MGSMRMHTVCIYWLHRNRWIQWGVSVVAEWIRPDSCCGGEGGATVARPPKIWSTMLFVIPFCFRMRNNKALAGRDFGPHARDLRARTHDEYLLFEHLKPHFDEVLPSPDLSLQIPHRENNLPAVRRPWLSVMDRSGAKIKCVSFTIITSLFGGQFFSFKVLNRCPSNFFVICTHEHILRV